MNTLHLALIRYKKTIRQPFTLILFAFNIAIVVLSSALPFFTFVKSLELKMFLDISIASTFIISSVVTIYYASTAIADEINDRTIFAIFSKTVSKLSYLAGNFIGLVMVSLTLYTLSYLLSDFAYCYNAFNNFYVYPSKIGLYDFFCVYLVDIFGGTTSFEEFKEMGVQIRPRYVGLTTFSLFPFIFKFFLVSFFNCLFMVSISVALSPFIPFGVNLISCMGIFSLANLHGVLSTKTPWISELIYSVIPRMDLFNASDALTMEVNFDWVFLLKLLVYSLIYSCFIIFMSSKLLERKEFI